MQTRHPLLQQQTFAMWLQSHDDWPEWLKSQKEKDWAQFLTLPMPKRTDEDWRFASTHRLQLEDYNCSAETRPVDTAALIERSDWLADYAGRIILADNHTIEAPNALHTATARSQALWTPLVSMLNEPDRSTDAAFLEEHLATSPAALGSEKFGALHAAWSSNGGVLRIPRGLAVETPFVIYHWATQPQQALFPHTLIIAEEQCQARVIEVFLSADPDAAAFVCASATIHANAGARIDYHAVQAWNTATCAIHLNQVDAQSHAEVQTVNINLGARYLRHEHQSRLLGPGSNVATHALSLPTQKQEIDQRTLQTHRAPNSRSDLLFKNALLDESRTIFSGLIRVDKEAQQTDAYQTNRNLLLSTAAEANALPGLEIQANDVKCSHGATSGYLDEKSLFYLLSRGIPKTTAQELMTFGFFEEILAQLPEEDAFAKKVRALISDKLHGRV